MPTQTIFFIAPLLQLKASETVQTPLTFQLLNIYEWDRQLPGLEANLAWAVGLPPETDFLTMSHTSTPCAYY